MISLHLFLGLTFSWTVLLNDRDGGQVGVVTPVESECLGKSDRGGVWIVDHLLHPPQHASASKRQLV